MNVGDWTWSRTKHVIIDLKCLPQICTKMNGFTFDFPKKFWGRGYPSPVFLGLRPRFGLALEQFSGALRLRLGLRPVALDSRALHSIRASPSTLDWRTWFAPLPPINSWIRQCLSVTIDDEFKMDLHVGCMVRSCFYQLRQIRTIRQSLSDNATRIHAFIHCHYCNSVLSGVACVAYDVRWRREARAEGGLTASINRFSIIIIQDSNITPNLLNCHRATISVRRSLKFSRVERRTGACVIAPHSWRQQRKTGKHIFKSSVDISKTQTPDINITAALYRF